MLERRVRGLFKARDCGLSFAEVRGVDGWGGGEVMMKVRFSCTKGRRWWEMRGSGSCVPPQAADLHEVVVNFTTICLLPTTATKSAVQFLYPPRACWCFFFLWASSHGNRIFVRRETHLVRHRSKYVRDLRFNLTAPRSSGCITNLFRSHWCLLRTQQQVLLLVLSVIGRISKLGLSFAAFLTATAPTQLHLLLAVHHQHIKLNKLII